MRSDNFRTIEIVESVDLEDAIGTISDLIKNEAISGSFGDYLYGLRSKKQVLLGHEYPSPVSPGGTVGSAQYIFVTKGIQYKRHAETWEDLRELLDQGWIIGTERRPGVKIWYPVLGRNHRRDPDDIFVFRK